MENSNREASSPTEKRGNEKQLKSFIHQWSNAVANPSEGLQPSSTLAFSPVVTMLEAYFAQGSAQGSANKKPKDASGTGFLYSNLMAKHCSQDPKDFERPARTEKTIDHLTAVGLLNHCTTIQPKKVKTKELRLVHTLEHIEHVDGLSFWFDLNKSENSTSMLFGDDLYVASDTSSVARLACGCAVEAAKAVIHRTVHSAFALVRPPGHHADANAGSGFCFFNNVAVAARASQEELKKAYPERYPGEAKPRVLIFDWDVHHCNGTESIFLEDPSVLVISIHQYTTGRGHILRRTKKPPPLSEKAMDEVTAEELAGFLLNDEGVSHADPAPQEEPSNDLVQVSRSKRKREEVDYNKLAQALGDTDELAAEVFGISSNPANTSSSTSSSAESFQSAKVQRLEGDSDGVSVDQLTAPADETDESELFYPGTGHLKDIGGRDNPCARGRNINIPCPTTGMGDLEYLQVAHDIVCRYGRKHNPDLVFISCGFDSARGDLLGSMNLTPSGYYAMTKLLAREFGSLVMVLEGGYNVKNVALCSEAVLTALVEEGNSTFSPQSRMLLCQMNNTIKRVCEEVDPFW